jgi:hypothetical protein
MNNILYAMFGPRDRGSMSYEETVQLWRFVLLACRSALPYCKGFRPFVKIFHPLPNDHPNDLGDGISAETMCLHIVGLANPVPQQEEVLILTSSGGLYVVEFSGSGRLKIKPLSDNDLVQLLSTGKINEVVLLLSLKSQFGENVTKTAMEAMTQAKKAMKANSIFQTIIRRMQYRTQ